jgi:hypothetical protein
MLSSASRGRIPKVNTGSREQRAFSTPAYCAVVRAVTAKAPLQALVDQILEPEHKLTSDGLEAGF